MVLFYCVFCFIESTRNEKIIFCRELMHMLCTNLESCMLGHFCFCHPTGNIVISSNLSARVSTPSPPSTHPMIFFETPLPHQSWCPPPWGTPHLKMKTPHWKVKPPSMKWFLTKKKNESETVINTGVSLIKQHWKEMTEIPQK